MDCQGLAIDHGAPIFVAKQEKFLNFLAPLVEAGAVKPWDGKAITVDGATPEGGISTSFDGTAYASYPDMNSMW